MSRTCIQQEQNQHVMAHSENSFQHLKYVNQKSLHKHKLAKKTSEFEGEVGSAVNPIGS